MKEKIIARLKQDYAHLGLDENTLSGLAEMLATSGLVTEQNLDTVVAAQKSYLENLQRSNDRRVQDALAKQQRKADETLNKAKEDNAAKLAELQNRLDQLTAKPAPETQPEQPQTNTPTDNANDEIRQQLADLRKAVETLQTAKQESETKLAEIQQQRAAEIAQQKREQRKQTIADMAKQKGLPDFLIAHGFADIADDASDEAINKVLDQYAQEIKTMTLPTLNGQPQAPQGKATREDTDRIVATLFPKANFNQPINN